MPTNFRRVVTLVFLVLSLLAGCASQPKLSQEERVGKRALEWADALMKLEYERALSYMTPTYQASPRSKQFRGEFGGTSNWQKAELKWVRCDAEIPVGRCSVRLILTVFKAPEMSTPVPMPYDTTWLYLDDNWYQYR